MDLNLTADQTATEDLFVSFFRAESTPALVRSTEDLGHSDDLWKMLAKTGAPAMALALSSGGGGAGLLEASLAAEASGYHLAPVPLVEHLVAARALERVGANAHARDAVDAVSPITIALQPASDWARTVPAGAVATAVLGVTDAGLVFAHSDPPREALPNSAGLALADRSLEGAEVLVEGLGGTATHERSVDEWRLLTAARLVGLAASALDLGVEYVCQRHQFGVPIGSFQAIQHGLAELPGQVSGARLLVRRAAWRADCGDTAGFGTEAQMAFLFSTELARSVTSRVLHYHGGYGVMEEYDIQLHYRRARGWPAQLEDPDVELERLADRLYGPAMSPLGVTGHS